MNNEGFLFKLQFINRKFCVGFWLLITKNIARVEKNASEMDSRVILTRDSELKRGQW